MKTADFDYHLPDELIAQMPLDRRTDSRLLYVPAGKAVEDRQFADVESLLNPGDLLVLNDTRVIPARLFGQKASGGKLEVLVERITSDHEALCHIRCSRSPKACTELLLEEQVPALVTGREGALFCVQFDTSRTVLEWLNEYGHMPLPPYIEREDTEFDQERYQTVFSDHDKAGAVAAPTAGLHFDEGLLERLKAKGVNVTTVTLHVGAGTFQPVKVDDVTEHVMHSERISVSQASCDAINQTRAAGGRVIAVGTTVVRSLESLPEGEQAVPWEGDTQIFITPGFRFRFIDALVTNFHLPKSTLLMLVSAFGGYPHMLDVYRHAVAQQYRFFSYGDAMLIEHLPLTAQGQE